MVTPIETGSAPLKAADLEKLKVFLVKTLSTELELNPPPIEMHRQVITQWLVKAYAGTKLELSDELRDHVFRDVLDELIGYGPIQPLLEDPTISEIMVNGPKLVFVERNGELFETDITFDDDAHVLRIIDRIIHPLGRRVDMDTPTADARLPDGSRVNVIVPPVSIEGPCITIRKFLENKLTVEDLIEMESLTPHMAEFLKACVVARLNIIITGNTSSGKTTLLNILASLIPGHERIVTIEDAAELQLTQRHIVRLETKSPNVDSGGEVTIRDLVRNTLRMRPDRIIVGEVRTGEAMDMLQAMNTGHDGSLTTLHANSPRDAIARLETMAMMAGLEMPLIAIRKQIAAAVDLIVQMSRLPDGSRKATQITEVAGMESDIVTLSDIFKFDQTGVSDEGKILGELKPTGIRPQFSKRLEVAGFKLGGEIFGVGFF